MPSDVSDGVDGWLRPWCWRLLASERGLWRVANNTSTHSVQNDRAA